jgi:hypothetical protein
MIILQVMDFESGVLKADASERQKSGLPGNALGLLPNIKVLFRWADSHGKGRDLERFYYGEFAAKENHVACPGTRNCSAVCACSQVAAF